MKWLAVILIAAGLVGLGWVRLAPSEPEEWHQKLNLPLVEKKHNGAVRFANLGETGLARLDKEIRATPRTRLLAGSLDEGMITYVTRSAVFGFPDYTTVQQVGDRLEIYGRARFGLSDMGVNAARIDAWLEALAP